MHHTCKFHKPGELEGGRRGKGKGGEGRGEGRNGRRYLREKRGGV